MRLTIRSKLTLLLLVLLVIAIGPLAWTGMSFFRTDKETSLQDMNAQTVAIQAQEIGQRLKATQRWLALLAATPQNENLRTLFDVNFRHHAWAGSFQLRGNRLRSEKVVRPRSKVPGESPRSLAKDAELIKNLKMLKVGNVRLIRRDTEKGPAIITAARLAPDLFGLALGPPSSIFNVEGSRKVYASILVDAEGNLIVHTDREEIPQGVSYSTHPLVTLLQNPAIDVGAQTTIYTDPLSQDEVMGAYAPLGIANAGLIVQVSKRQAFAAAQDLIKKFGFMALVIFSVAVLFSVIFAGSLTKPIRQLGQLTKSIGKGDFNVKIEHSSVDELGDLTQAFNKMGEELIFRDEKLEHAKKQLVQSEKMGAFGQMSAGIAHEVKNPLAGILGYAQLAKKKARENEGLIKYLAIIEKETKRCKDIVENLMRFARQEKVEFEDMDINQVAKDSAVLVDHQVTISGHKFITNYAEDGSLPQVYGSGNQIQQVLTNLMLNAQQAMKDPGTITLTTRSGENGFAEVEVTDTGEGIAPEHLEKIFEPFFTTKPAGKGTGLGLAVTYGIIKDHKGDIKVRSEVGKGTTFTIQLPAKGTVSA